MIANPMTTMHAVTLDVGEMTVAQMLASMRFAVNRANGVQNARVGPQSFYQMEMDGIVAELAFCKWRNVCPDMTIVPRSGGADCVVDGKTIDVKATRRQDGKLLCVTGKAVPNAEIYVLAIVNDNAVSFPGWAFADELMKPENITNLGHGPTYALDQSQLRQFKS